MPPANSVSWKQLILAFTANVKFSAPASEAAIAVIAQELHIAIPQNLRDLFLECDGVTADYGSHVVWSISEIQRRNIEFRQTEAFRELYMPFDHLFFFGDDGGGDQFAFAIQADGSIHNHDIIRWEHETDARSWYAGNLRQYFEHRFGK